MDTLPGDGIKFQGGINEIKETETFIVHGDLSPYISYLQK